MNYTLRTTRRATFIQVETKPCLFDAHQTLRLRIG